ncbi:MAG: dTDP-glucose 4,6-dehydratase [Adlercreutzia equolifaciens]
MSDQFKNIVVTGGAGFIGSNFVHWVLDNQPDAHVTVLDALTYAGNRENLAGRDPERMTFVHGDICDADLVDRLFAEADACVHFAAESHNDNSIADPSPFLRTNVEGTFTLLQAARNHGVRFHHISTDEVYGDLALDDPNRFTEETPYCPSSPYSSTRRLRHARPCLASHLWRGSHHINAEQLRILSAYRSSSLGRSPTFWRHPPEALRDGRTSATGFTPRILLCRLGHPHPDDASEKLISSEPMGADNIDVLRYPRRHGQGRRRFRLGEDEPGHDRRYAIDSTKLRRELGWSPKHTNFDEGLARTIRWYTDNPSWWQGAKETTKPSVALRVSRVWAAVNHIYYEFTAKELTMSTATTGGHSRIDGRVHRPCRMRQRGHLHHRCDSYEDGPLGHADKAYLEDVRH